MTPQIATLLKIHEPDTVPVVARERPGGTLVALPQRRPGLVDGAGRAHPSAMRRERLHRRLLGVADVLGAGLALVLTLALFGGDHDQHGLVTLAGVPLVLVVFKLAGLYDRDQMRLVHSTLDEAPNLAQLTGLYALTVAISQPLLFDGHLSGSQIAFLWVSGFAAVTGGRVIARRVADARSPVERCLVVGDVGQTGRIRDKLAASHAHAAVVASLSLDRDDLEELRDSDAIRRIVVELQLHRIIIAPADSGAGTECVTDLIRAAKAAGAQVSVLPRMLEVVGSAVEFEDIDGMTLLGVRPFGLSRSSRLVKRTFDLAAGLIGLLAVAPIIAVIALAIRLDSKGPVFFRQIRVGRDGRPFHIFKFRSMGIDAEREKLRLLELSEVGDDMFKMTDDPRVTRVGRILRRTSLDELPQFFNVVRGEMSLVGPRPLVTDEDARVHGLDRSRLHLTPGMTGPWQVLGCRVPMEEMVGIDYLYVSNWSLWLDLKLLLRTVRHVLRGGNV